MLKIFDRMRDLSFGQLMEVYEEGNRENGIRQYPKLSENQQLMQTEQDFYAFLQVFFQEPDAVYAVWVQNGVYTAALRLEPYRDGMLLEALETLPRLRRRGYARALIQETKSYLRDRGVQKLYSHVHKKNMPSIAVHEACGFQRVLEHAVYIDGSVDQYCCTLLCSL